VMESGDSFEKRDEKRDTNSEEVNLDAQKSPSPLESSMEDHGALSEGEVFIPAKRPRTTPEKKLQRNDDRRHKAKSANPNRNDEKKHKSTNGKKDSGLLQPELPPAKSKPINLRTAVCPRYRTD
jgi:hypothetical protein